MRSQKKILVISNNTRENKRRVQRQNNNLSRVNRRKVCRSRANRNRRSKINSNRTQSRRRKNVKKYTRKQYGGAENLNRETVSTTDNPKYYKKINVHVHFNDDSHYDKKYILVESIPTPVYKLIDHTGNDRDVEKIYQLPYSRKWCIKLSHNDNYYTLVAKSNTYSITKCQFLINKPEDKPLRLKNVVITDISENSNRVYEI